MMSIRNKFRVSDDCGTDKMLITLLGESYHGYVQVPRILESRVLQIRDFNKLISHHKSNICYVILNLVKSSPARPKKIVMLSYIFYFIRKSHPQLRGGGGSDLTSYSYKIGYTQHRYSRERPKSASPNNRLQVAHYL